MNDAVFKMCIFGDGGVGKTTLTQKYVTGLFDGGTRMTIGADFHIKILDIEGKRVALQIWDFAGERQFRFLLPSYVKGASGGIFMYDITRFSSLKNMDEWLDALSSELDTINQVPIIMVGGKADLEDRRAVGADWVKQIVEEKNFAGFFECSAKTGDNVELIFETLTRLMLQRAGII